MNVAVEVKRLKIGEKIRELRLKRRNTLRQVAGKTGLSIPLLSQVENNAVSPPVATLLRIAKALGVSIGYFFREEESKERAVVVRKHERKKTFRPIHNRQSDGGYTYEALAYTKNSKHMEPFLVEFKPKKREAVSFLSHQGEEFIFLFRGRLAFHYDQQEIILGPGDSLYFESEVPHGLRALRGRKAQAIVVVFSKR
ncbi:MAG: helix-turn-helix transcriptional regulator [Syntrophaceae bacterium]|jgi:transcriptional regulator with XRE-family HTH domain|nr:helix-turn-helix transcriptional regulator [Syntrophaceae bacterium]